jgi:hypothetical protein
MRLIRVVCGCSFHLVLIVPMCALRTPQSRAKPRWVRNRVPSDSPESRVSVLG